MYYINVFFVYSIFGYLFESFIGIIRKTGFNSGILYGPWTPIYGIGVNIILIVSKVLFKNLYLVWWREMMIVFFILVLSLTFIEWLGGILIEKIFRIVFWNYEEFTYHIGKYIAVEISILWGILSLILIYGIHPYMNKIINSIPNYLTVIFVVLMVLDYILTFIKYKRVS